MPVRIYEIAREVGIPSKEVLARAKDLGIANAKVASSSLDKITAAYLVEKLSPQKEESGKPEEPAPQAHEPVVITAPPEEEKVEEEAVPGEESEPAEEIEGAQEAVVESDDEPVVETPATETAEEAPPEPAAGEPVPAGEEIEGADEAPGAAVEEPRVAEDEEEKGPQIGDKVGFIQLSNLSRKPAKAARPEKREKGRREPDRQQPADATAPSRKFPEIKLPPNAPSVTMKSPIIVRDLAASMQRKPFQIIADLMEMNIFANVNQAIEEDVAKHVCARNGFRFEMEKRERRGGVTKPVKSKVALDRDDDPKDLKPRPPVITIMGHVDHGKTTLLDVIRKSNVVSGEAGGITQHIGAYTISVPHPERPKDLLPLTFIDTPGHAAFSAMRARGANVTDIVVLVVAANDGVKPQTEEAISHARAAEVPIIVAVNKTDAPGANPMQTRQQLQERGLVCEEWGGETIFQDVSALKRENIDKLLELILLQAEILELKANPNRKAIGNVIESGIERAGPTATVLVRKGTLKVGDAVICENYWGRVKALIDDQGKRTKEAGPSVAVKLLGLNGAPEAGSEFSVIKNEKEARELGEQRQIDTRAASQETRQKMTLENLFSTLAEGRKKELKVVIKADTQGSTEAIVEALEKIAADKVSLDILHSGVGTVSESDVMLCSASDALILGFHTRIDSGVQDLSKREGVQIRMYKIIYELVDEVKDAMAGLLEPVDKEVDTGAADVHKVFPLSKGGNVAGCIVSSGRISKGKCRVLRKGRPIHTGEIVQLRRFQDDVNEVRSGLDCGIRVAGFDDFEAGDVIECFNIEKVAQKL